MVAYTATGLYLLMGGVLSRARTRAPRRGPRPAPRRSAESPSSTTDLPGHQRLVGGRPVLGQEVHAGGTDVALDHADDVAAAPPQRVAHPVDHHRDRCRGCCRGSRPGVRASRASPVGSAEPTTTTWSAAATASRVSWLRESVRPRSASSSRLNPVSTTTSPTSAARSSTASSTPGRASTQRSGRGRPVSTSKSSATTRRQRANDAASREPTLTRRAAASRPETSSSTPRCWATAPPCGSASTSTARLPRWACSAASPIATVVRPGAPAGPCTAITRPGAAVDVGDRLGSSGSGSTHQRHGCRPTRRPRAAWPSSVERHELPRTPIRSRARADPPTATHRTSSRSSCITASASSPPSSPDTTATSACPVPALASRSARSTHRLSTTSPSSVEQAQRRGLPGLAARGEQHRHPVGHRVSPSWRRRRGRRRCRPSAVPSVARRGRRGLRRSPGGSTAGRGCSIVRGHRDHDDVGQHRDRRWPAAPLTAATLGATQTSTTEPCRTVAGRSSHGDADRHLDQVGLACLRRRRRVAAARRPTRDGSAWRPSGRRRRRRGSRRPSSSSGKRT